MHTVAHRTCLPRLAGVAVGLAVAMLWAAGPSLATEFDAAQPATGPSPPPGPQLSIAIDNGGTATKAGATLTYTIIVRNLGSAAVENLQVTQSVPEGLEVKSVASDGRQEGGDVTWEVNLEAAGETTFQSTMTVVDTPPELLRLATVACAGTSDTEPPIVCATHSDQLPAGAAAEQNRAAPGTDASGVRWWWFVAGAAVLLVVAFLVVLYRKRGGRPSRSPGATSSRHHHDQPTQSTSDSSA